MKTIVLFTGSYPYSKVGEYTFIEPELKVLNKYFKIILVPLSKEINTPRQLLNNLDNISVEDIRSNKLKEVFNILKIDIFLLKELKRVKNFKQLKDLLIRHIKLKWIEKVIFEKLKNGEWQAGYLYYTYWFDYATSALLRLKNRFNLKVVTRAHGYDLYEERRGGYIPFREDDAKKIDYIITISMQGYNYLKNKYNLSNIKNFYLGIPDHKINCPFNNNKYIKIISCALMSPIKRIDLTMKYLSKFSEEFKQPIKWYHIGDGILRQELFNKKTRYEHKYFEINLVGYLENEKIFEFYKYNSFDYFITLSASEGLPVSLIEACSVGLPIIATNVGGISEIVYEDKNGFLLSENPTYEEFKEKFEKAIEYKNDLYKLKRLRSNAREIYLEKFNAETNHEKFAKFLQRLWQNND